MEIVGALSSLPVNGDLVSGPIVIHVQNDRPSSYPIRIRLSETTLYSTRWSSNGYDAVVAIQNTTTCLVTGTVVLLNAAGSSVASLPVELDPLSSTQIRVDSSLPAISGSAYLTHCGPPGALNAGIYMISTGSGRASFRWPMREVRPPSDGDRR